VRAPAGSDSATRPLDAFYLPLAIAANAETTLQSFGAPPDPVEIRLPVVTAEAIARWIEQLRAAREEHLSKRSTAATLRTLHRVVERFLDPRAKQRTESIAALARAGSFSAPMVAQALDDAFQPLARGGLTRWLGAELGSAQALDRPVAGPAGTRRRAHGPTWMLQIYAGNVPTVPVLPLFGALLLKSALLAKTAAQEPIFAPHLARAIAGGSGVRRRSGHRQHRADRAPRRGDRAPGAEAERRLHRGERVTARHPPRPGGPGRAGRGAL
jgi:hypothetical protein